MVRPQSSPLTPLQMPAERHCSFLRRHLACERYSRAKLASNAHHHHASTQESHTHAREPGWAGIAAASADEEAIVVTACQFEKRLTLYQSGRMLRSLGSLHQPQAVTYITNPGRDCIALAEGHQVGSIGKCTLTLQCYQKHTCVDKPGMVCRCPYGIRVLARGEGA